MPRSLSLLARVVLVLLVLVALPLAAQTVTGTIEGTVLDSSGGALPGVTVTIRNLETGFERVVVTNENGFFSAPFVPIGRYDVRAELAGLGDATHHNVGVELNTRTVQNFKLDPKVSETITVRADAPHIDVADGEIKQTLNPREIEDKSSLAANSFLSLAEVFTGYQENPTSGQNNPFNSSGSSINFNGTGTRGATFQINGVNNDDASENQNRQGVPLAQIQSFQAITNNYTAEFGRGYGAVILVQTKQGTNDVQGEFYDYVQKGKWNDKSFFSQQLPKPNNHRYQYGATLGFPVIRDTLFGYFGIDKVDNAGDRTYARDIFLPSEFTAPRLTMNNDTPANRAFIESVLARFPKVTPNDPRSARTYATLQDTDFPDNDYSGRGDWNINTKNTATARYQRSNQTRIPQDVILGENVYQRHHQSSLGVTWTNVLSPTAVEEARVAVGVRSTNGDIGAGNDTPVIRFSGSPVSGSTIGSSTNFPINRHQRDNQLVYNLSSILFGRHTIKTGLDVRRSSLNDHAENGDRGFYTFTRTCGGQTFTDAYAAFLAGCVNTYTKAYGPAELETTLGEENVYAQDEWHMRDSLTLNLGARFERVDPTKERENRIDYGVKATHYVDPRLSFAYTPDWSRGGSLLRSVTGGPGRFVIRGGFGVSHGRVFQSLYSQNGANIRYNPPFASTQSFLNATNISDPTNGFVFTPGVQKARFGTVVQVDPGLRMPETRQWNLTFERRVFSQSRLRVSYVGTLGKGLLQYRFDNLPLSPLNGPVTVVDHPFNAPTGTFPDLRGKQITAIAADWRCAGTGFYGIAKTADCPNVVPIADNEISLRVPRTNERRPNPLYGNILTINNGADSWYHAAQLEWETGVVHGFSGRASYTFSKAIDTGSEATGLDTGDTNILGPHYEFARGLSRFDTRHRFTFVGGYDLPFFKSREGFAGALLGGWRLSTTVRIASGTPFTVIDSNGVDIDFDGFNERRPVLVDPSINGNHVDDHNNSTSQLPRSAFRSATPNDKLSDLVGRNTFFTDGVRNVDAALAKTIPAVRGTSIVLRLEAFNVFNHIQWGFPNNDIASSTFGQIIRTNYTPRTYQAVVRLLY